MTQFLFLCLTVSNLALRIDCQSVFQEQIPNIINPDQIYFADNRPQSSKHINRQINSPSVELQPPYEAPINGLNTAQRPINDPNVEYIPVNNFNLAPVPYEVIKRNSGEEERDVRQNIRFDQHAAALTNFSLNVMRTVIEQKQGNTVLSPYSVASLLALLQQGAVEQALDQISVALQMSPRVSAAAYRSYSQDIKRRTSRNILKTANNIFVAESFSLNPQFRDVAQADFDSALTSTAFERPERAAQQINTWVASKTSYKIDKLIAPESIAVNTQMVLVNAIYFKGLWETPFRPQVTKTDAFWLRDGTAKNVLFMMTRQQFKAGLDTQSRSRVAVLPFEREEYSLMIILPSPMSNADNVLRSLTVSQLENYLSMKPMEVALKLPKFTIRADTDLAPILRQMGVTKIFEQSSGLSLLGMFRTFTPQVSTAVHSAVLSIDEEGGSAAAASAFGVVALSNDQPYMALKVDRPFVAVLWDEKTKTPLFMAKIEDPSL